MNFSSSVLVPKEHRDTDGLEKCSPVGRPASPQEELTFGRQCWRPARRPPASSSGQRSCLPAAPPSRCCRFFGCSPGSQTLKKKQKKTPQARCSVPALALLGLPPADVHLLSFKSSPDSGAGVRLPATAVCASLRRGGGKSSGKFLSLGGCARKRMIS